MARDNGGIIGPANNPTSDSASGVWDLPAQYQAISGGNWPPIPTIAANSLRFNGSGSDDYLYKTFASDGNRKTYTISAWVKRSQLGRTQVIFHAGNNSADTYPLHFISTDKLEATRYSAGYTWRVTTSRVFRDTSAWYHIVVAVDTTQATASDRVKMYVNGVQETSFDNTSYPTLNSEYEINDATYQHNFGFQTTFNDFDYGGYMSECVFTDGQALDPTSFGQFNANGIWTPIPIGISSYGTNGFQLKFENSASLGLDSSPNGNNWTVNNLTSIDQSTDIPTNNFCTMNPLITRSGTAATYSEGNLKVVWSHSVNVPTMGTLGVQSGKWYYESKMFWGSNSYIGITYDSTPTNTDVTGYLLRQTGQKYDAFTGSGSSYTSALSSGDTVMIAFDADNGTLWFGVNGTWSNGATQTEIENGTTTNSAFSSIDMSYIWLPMGKGGISSNARIEANFGNPIYTISSGNSDANGYGNFEYTVPSGYYSWNSKNLAEFG